MKRFKTSFHHLGPKAALLAALFLTVVPTALARPGSEQAGFAQPEEIWITLGTDAFEALQGQPGLRSLDQLATRSGIVLTRVRVEDLETISTRLHELTRRCAGFIAHRTLERAEQALEAVARESAARGAGDYTINQHALVEDLEAGLGKLPILGTIQHLSTAFINRFYAHPSGVAAAQWIHDQWQGYAQNRADVTVDLVQHPGIPQRSVVLTIPGTTWPEEVVILGAHLDSITQDFNNPDFFGPGADDDASGIATLSEVIRVAMAGGFFPQRTVQFMGYAAEEIGLVGSQDIAVSYQAAGVDVVAVLQFDMVGYFGSNIDIAFVGDFTDSVLSAFLGELVDTYQSELLWTTTFCGYGCSDHAAWTQAGFPASFPVEARFGQHNPTIHTAGDTLATLGNNVDHAFKFTRLGVAYTVEVGNPVIAAIFADGFESGSTTAWSIAVP